jgi:acetyl-CoA acetyltransferase
MKASFRDRTAIVGVGETEVSRNSGRTETQLAVEAAVKALDDCGLTAKDIDAVARFGINAPITEATLAANLGIPDIKYTALGNMGGSDSHLIIQHAAMMIEAGAQAVLIFRSLNGYSGSRYGQPRAIEPRADEPKAKLLPKSVFAAMPEEAGLAMQRYMYLYGVTNEDLGRYAVQARAYAARNPTAYFYGKPITLEDHQSSRWIAPPALRLLDCALEVDSAIAMIITSTERARDLKQPPVAITTAAQSVTAAQAHQYHPGFVEPFDGQSLGDQLWSGAGLGPQDMDAAMFYDNFSPLVYITLEALGLCKPGEAKDLINAGETGPNGSLPVNTHGGHIHQGYHAHGLNHALEAVQQIRGTSANQLPKPANHVVTGSYRTGAILSRI